MKEKEVPDLLLHPTTHSSSSLLRDFRSIEPRKWVFLFRYTDVFFFFSTLIVVYSARCWRYIATVVKINLALLLHSFSYFVSLVFIWLSSSLCRTPIGRKSIVFFFLLLDSTSTIEKVKFRDPVLPKVMVDWRSLLRFFTIVYETRKKREPQTAK